jgi:hypothetical protein
MNACIPLRPTSPRDVVICLFRGCSLGQSVSEYEKHVDCYCLVLSRTNSDELDALRAGAIFGPSCVTRWVPRSHDLAAFHHFLSLLI